MPKLWGYLTNRITQCVEAFRIGIRNEIYHTGQEHKREDEGNQPRDGGEQCNKHGCNYYELQGQEKRLRHEPSGFTGTSSPCKYTMLTGTHEGNSIPKAMPQSVCESFVSALNHHG